MSFSGLEVHSEPCQTSEMGSFVKVVNGFEACQGSEYASASFSLTGEIFTQKSNNWFYHKKGIFKKVYHNLHISE